MRGHSWRVEGGHMKALVATDYGPPQQVLRVAEVPPPAPGPGQVLVKVAAAALNPVDVGLITGGMRQMMPIRHPFVIGMDASGTVASVGTGVTGYAGGEPVLGFSSFIAGTVAEYTVIDAGPCLARRPADLDPLRGAAIPESGLTAKHLLRAAELKPGQSMLVVGATGGIGMFAVQLAAAGGVEVIATAPPPDMDYVLGLGAAHVVDYTADDVVKQTLVAYPDGVDVVLDLVNAGPALADVAVAARPGGRVVSPLAGPSDLGPEVTAVYIGRMTPKPGDLDDLASRAASGGLHIEVGAAYPLDQAVSAVMDFAGKHVRGKVVITV
jgi:NADPH:quinone reductase-like Zn-dependent oxidoreductase